MKRRTNNEYSPQSVTHPGVTLLEKLEEVGIGVKEFAIRTDKPEKTIIAVLNGESSITPDMAVQFERVLKIPAHFWLKRQIIFDEFVARTKEALRIEEAISWMKKFPVRQMIKLMWLPETRSDKDKAKALLDFFGVASYTAWESYYLGQKLKVAFRLSLAHTNEAEAISAWLRRGEILANDLNAPSYNKVAFEGVLNELKRVMVRHPEDFSRKLQDTALGAGVKVVYTPCLPKAPINGATRWLGDTPVIQLSGRYKRNDIFWFTFFHEAGHILKHGKKDIFLENVDYSELDMEKEQEANEFAIRYTLSHTQYKEILKLDDFSDEAIVKMANKFKTHPAIIIGRLQHDGKLDYNLGRHFFQAIELN